MKDPILVVKPTPIDRADDKSSLLKLLRQNKKISRTKLSKLTRLSTYQVEGLEGKNTQNLLERTLLCIKALGYKAEDIVNVIECARQENKVKFPRGTIGKPLFEIYFQEGVKLFTCFQENGCYLGVLQLAIGKALERGRLPAGDIILGIVREGTLVIDVLVKQTVYKKDQFFILPGNLPAELSNGDSFVQASVLLFTLKYPS